MMIALALIIWLLLRLVMLGLGVPDENKCWRPHRCWEFLAEGRVSAMTLSGGKGDLMAGRSLAHCASTKPRGLQYSVYLSAIAL